ncbi:MAG: ABC transporter ATP-binding protein, partial [Prevotella sp.]|nr:ABC transporter ATP-binding protein [Prevotella sp.]
QKEQQRKLKKAEKAVKACEEKIAQMEAQLKEMDAILMQPEHASDMKLINEYAEIMRNLEAENDRWMTLSEELEALQA